VVTPTPPGDNAKLTTTITTISTLYVAGYTTTNSGMSTIIPPSTLYVIEKVAITEIPTVFIGSAGSLILYDFNSHGLRGVTMSLVIVITTFIFMIVA